MHPLIENSYRMSLFTLIVLAVVTLGLVAALVYRFFLDDPMSSHARLVRDTMALYGFEEHTVKMNMSIEASAVVGDMAVGLDFGLDAIGYDALRLSFELSEHAPQDVHLLSQGVKPQTHSRGLGDPSFDDALTCLMGASHIISLLDPATRHQMTALLNSNTYKQRQMQWRGRTLIIERKQETSSREGDDVALDAFFKDAIEMAQALNARIEVSAALRLVEQVEDATQPLLWRQEALVQMVRDDIQGIDKDAVFWRFVLSKSPHVEGLKDTVYLYSLHMFEPSNWRDEEQWIASLVDALNTTTHREVFEALAEHLLNARGLPVLSWQWMPHTRDTLHRYAYQSGYAQQIVDHQVGELEQMSVVDWSKRVGWLAGLGVALPLAVLDAYAQQWREHIAVSYGRDADPMPALTRALLVQPTQQTEARVLTILSIPSSEAHSLCFEWLNVYGTRDALGELHRLSQPSTQSSFGKRAQRTIDAIMTRVNDGAAGGISLSEVDAGSGKLSMLQRHGEVTVVKASGLVFDLDDIEDEAVQVHEHSVEVKS